MSEPVNPLFEEEKEFLERKKLEYERALRGDVEHLREQGVQVGKVALVGAGVVGGIWLLSKAIGGRKRRKTRREWEDDYDDYRERSYDSQYFADLDEENDRWDGPVDQYFGGEHAPDHGHGAVYHTDTDHYDDPTGPLGPTSFDDDEAAADDNGLSEFPDFPPHSASGHGEDASAAGEPLYDDDSLPYDDSRRLPDGNEFEEPARPGLGHWLAAFAKSSVGKMVIGEAISIAAALAAKALSDRLAHSEADTAKNADLAASTAVGDGYAHGHPASPQPAAPDATAFAADFPTTREPLA